MTRPKILLTGGRGQVGSQLLPRLSSIGDCVAPGRSELDLTKPDQIRSFVRRVQPAVIVNAAGYTQVDRAETDPDDAFALNHLGPAALAQEAAALGAWIVHYSTDYVFDGTSKRPYVETDAVTPLNVYGQSKARGDEAVASSGAPHLILRTSWVYGPSGVNFPRTILRLARERDELRVVDDQIGAPTSAIFLADVTAVILARAQAEPDGSRRWSGVYNLTASGTTSWYNFARVVLEQDPRSAEQRAHRLIPITTAEYPTPARRPAFSVLDCSKVESAFGIRRTGWTEQLREVMRTWVW